MKAYKIAEVAEMLQVDPRTVKREIERGNLKARKVGSDYRVPELNLVEYMQLVHNNYKSEREVQLEQEVEQLKKKLEERERFISSIKDGLLRLAI